MTGKLKKRLIRIIAGGVAFLAAILIINLFPQTQQNNISLLMFLAAYLIVGIDVVKKACKNILNGQIFDENFLMLLATVGAFLISEYPEAVAVMLFYQVGEWFQSFAVNRSRKSIKDLMNIRPDYANLVYNNEERRVEPQDVHTGDTICIRPGEKIPLDGVVIKGNSTLDTMALTGESVPREISENEEIISGCVNLTGVLYVKVTKEFEQSTVSKILDLVENASAKKASSENFITRFARVYTPAVVIAAVALAILPPLLLHQEFATWIYRALTFLVISCPCALVISVPLSFFGGIGGAGRAGILVKGSTYLELLSKTEVVVMDKTGTLTKGSFAVQKIVPALESDSEDILLEQVALAESFSNHPISISLKKAYGREIDFSRVSNVEELAGYGISAMVDQVQLYVGNAKLMQQKKIEVPKVENIGTVIFAASDKRYLGYILIADEIKEDAEQCVHSLKKSGIQKVVMLTGDREETAAYVAKKVGITEYYSQLLPTDKVELVEKLFQEKSREGQLVFVGDGINDAPVLARADIGIAMGGLGSDAAIEAADIVIMNDEPARISLAMKISKKTLQIVHENIIFAIGVKLLVLVLAALGMASMWAAVFADVGVAVIAILNAMRAMKIK